MPGILQASPIIPQDHTITVEDLSIFSRDQQNDRMDIDSGGRALAALVRPYARKIAGEPLRMTFDLKQASVLRAFPTAPADQDSSA